MKNLTAALLTQVLNGVPSLKKYFVKTIYKNI